MILQLSNGGADLEVIVKEADGSTSYYRVPYSSVPNMLQLAFLNMNFQPDVVILKEPAINLILSGSYQHGFNNLLTGYGGTLLSDNYSSFVLGTGWNTPIGAISVDFTHSYSKQDNGDVFNGQSYQIARNKYLSQSGTQFSLAAALFLSGLSYF